MYQCADVGYKCGWEIMTLLIFIKNTILFIAKWSYKIKKGNKDVLFPSDQRMRWFKYKHITMAKYV